MQRNEEQIDFVNSYKKQFTKSEIIGSIMGSTSPLVSLHSLSGYSVE